MLGNKKNLIALIVATVVLAGIFLFYLWRFSANGPAASDSVGRVSFPESGLSVFRPAETGTTPDFSGFSSFSDISKSAGFSALSFEDFLSEGGRFFEENFSVPATTPFMPSPVLPSFTLRPALSEEEIFERVWTTDYLRTLKQIEGLVIKDGLLPEGFDVGALDSISSEEVGEGEIIQNWSVALANEGIPETDEEVYETILNILGEARASELITQIEYDNFKNGVTGILPQIIEAEKEAFRRGLISKNVLPKDQYFIPASRSDEAVKDLLDGLAYVFGIARPAEAAWVRGADCYKDDAPFFPVPGFNGATFCCNCGIHIHCSSRGCFPHFHADCGGSSGISVGGLASALSNFTGEDLTPADIEDLEFFSDTFDFGEFFDLGDIFSFGSTFGFDIGSIAGGFVGDLTGGLLGGIGGDLVGSFLGGGSCDIPLGCLNAVCGGWPNAIWDPTTGICGCG